MSDSRLDEFDKREWWDVARALKPALTEKEFDAMWARFQQAKAEHIRNSALN